VSIFSEHWLLLVSLYKRQLDLKRHSLSKLVASILENGELETLHVDFEKIHGLDFFDVVETIGLHWDFARDAAVVAEGNELLQLARIRLQQARYRPECAHMQSMRATIADRIRQDSAILQLLGFE
jgi:hypothetical protein